ncbi:MAG: hypothetical protein ACYC35_12990 [Pirellulales bacterium]
MVDGDPVWFESADVALRPSPEAFASSFFGSAIHRRRPLYFRGPLSAAWRENVAKMLGLWHEWWDYPETFPIESQADAAAGQRHPDSVQAFSGGCDSFYTLLRKNHPTRYLVFVHGFDISYRDRYRMRKYRDSFHEVCRATGKIPIVIRTNLRRHPLFAAAPWERTHGGALAAIGHLLSDVAGQLVIASSYTYDDPHPCGSHWRTDPLWSSDRLEVFHDDATLYRLNKLKTMDAEPLVQRSLRVCWQNKATFGNCSRCDKCVRTMIVLAMRGQLQNYPVFDRHTPLADILDSMDPVSKDVYRRYEELIAEGMPPDLEAAARRLLARQRPARFSSVRHTIRKARLVLARVHG